MALIHLVLILIVPFVALSKLIQVQVLSRHGLRALFAHDEINVWDDGGVLSGVGYRQMKELGDALHNRYRNSSNPGFVETDWNQTMLPGTLLAHSTDTQTAIMSSISFMVGFIPFGTGPIDEVTKQPALPNGFAPVPIHTIPMPQDIPLRAYDKCPNFLDQINGAMNTKEIAEFESKNQAMLQKLGALTQTNVTASSFLDAYEIVYVDHAHGNSEISDTDWVCFHYKEIVMDRCANDVLDTIPEHGQLYSTEDVHGNFRSTYARWPNAFQYDAADHGGS